ncbi:hypothetical protein Pse7367_3735 (plasmid) [Thalassoporum mexicanum PCC 7367]|uniref:DUF6876 family protein n=1 Tax=Thalassoporum mexicanum TaxID=3457544 RepID=UPI00029FB6EA|nr:DUF6876 family protein [Pseudanabaena sp. PCC 7367]AFY71961.1 hypothetical protein Pse7367_3735 [Pseudanabaena sp. PCC 7367]
MSDNPKRQEILSTLGHFCGSETIYRHPLFKGLYYTEGVQYLAEAAGAYWLVEAVFSHQINPKVKSNQALQEFQIWELKVAEDKSAVLTCLQDTDQPILSQEIEYSDFCLSEIKFYLCNNVLMLPSEY